VVADRVRAVIGFELGELIGRGGMGVVYLATDVKLQRPVALKLIAPELAEDPRFRKRFLEESRLAASLDHASVVPIYEAGEQDGQLFLAMRYVEGSDLRTLLRRDGSLELERTLALLGQIASALDAAHRSRLVHRDVKPANILVDEDEHAYLTDFGVSKQLGGVTTDTGRLVGSLDYLAPEQIAGDRVGARSDQYALACVLYECLTGAPAFRRESEAETLWAHMQGRYEPVPGLERVFKRAFARDPKDRYGSCGELIAAARERTRVPHRVRWIGAALAALAAGVAVALYFGDGDVEALPPGSFVVAFGSDGGIGSFTEATSAPSNIAVGEGAVWVLDSEAETVARLDPVSKAVRQFSAGARPTDLAAGGGAVWVGTGAGSESFQTRVTTGISRVDPGSLKVTRTIELSREENAYGPPPSVGFPQMAIGAGALWAAGADNRVYRIDLATGRIVAKIPVVARVSTLAAGAEGVWFLNWTNADVSRIDPATNRVTDRIRVDSGPLAGIAVGGGSVWVTSQDDGRLWRIEPGRRPRAIDVGGQPDFVGYGDGAAWTGDYRDGVLARVDARTNAVTRRVRIDAAQALTVGAGSAWVSVAGGTRAGTLPPAACTPVESGGATPDVLIVSDLPLQGPDADITRGLADATRWVLKDHGFHAGRHVVGYQSCDESTAQTGDYEQRRCAANAHAFARDEQVVAVIGPFSSWCAQLQIPILNRALGGPLVLVSPTNSDPGLTRGRPIVPAGAAALDRYYPTGTRNYARVIGRADVEGVALALLARRLRLGRVYLLDPRDDDLRSHLADPFRRAAGRLGVGIAGSEEFGLDAHAYAAVAGRVMRARVDGIVIGGPNETGGPLVKALRARLGPRVAIMVGDQFYVDGLLHSAGRAAHGVYLATSEAVPAAGSLTPAAARFVALFGTAAHRHTAINGAAAAEVVLQAIARSDGTRASVLRSLRSLHVSDGILGSFTFDRGDISPARVTVMRVTGSTPKGVRLPIHFEGAAVERVIEVPASLSG
jgi:ABC-type branched-subunit amino acid transport system substrate-binding protein/DNA-binding beta-propeller fold protein YncE/predicted Ser/Thr protein kinase